MRKENKCLKELVTRQLNSRKTYLPTANRIETQGKNFWGEANQVLGIKAIRWNMFSSLEPRPRRKSNHSSSQHSNSILRDRLCKTLYQPWNSQTNKTWSCHGLCKPVFKSQGLKTWILAMKRPAIMRDRKKVEWLSTEIERIQKLIKDQWRILVLQNSKKIR